MVKFLTYWDLLSNIKANRVAPVYLFTGDEVFLKRSAEEKIKLSLVPASLKDFNYQLFFAEQADLSSVLDCLKTQPFMCQRRVLVLRDAEKFSNFEKNIITYLKNPCLSSCFIVYAKNKNSKFVKNISKFTENVLFEPLKGQGLKKWINHYLRNKNKLILPQAMEVLFEKVGSDLGVLSSSLDKLCLFIKDAREIKVEHIELLIKKTHTDTKFSFLNALSKKDVSRALTIFNDISSQSKNFIEIIGLLNWQMQRMLVVKRLVEKKCSSDQISLRLSLSSYAVNNLKKQVYIFSVQELENSLDLLLKSDVALKTGTANSRLVLENLIVRICSNVYYRL
ncbi:MAG: DNA polymerase III subunit delta [Candidatus Omnitrophota bacterium]|nr:MAG: DNA polymerase III subunit delta [Candidatus Omnitrophota bacterium]